MPKVISAFLLKPFIYAVSVVDVDNFLGKKAKKLKFRYVNSK